jgi:hypothetical protein
MPKVFKDGSKIPAEGEGEKPQRSSWRELLLRPILWAVITFVFLQIIERVIEWMYHDSTKMLSKGNALLIEGVRDVQPWHGAALFWKSLTTNWPADLSPIGIPFFLFGRIIGGGLQAIMLPLSGGWKTAIPALVGYGLGLYITWMIFADSSGKLNFLVGILGIIFVGGLCLVALQPLMILITKIFNTTLGTVSAGSAFLLSLPFPFSKEFIKHVIGSRAEAMLKKAIKGSGTPLRESAAKEELPAASLKGNTTFRLKGYQGARLVTLSGAFNNWNPSTTVFARGRGEWLCRIDLAPGKHQYKFVVDGQWIVDPGNPNTEEDSSGNVNSVLVIRSK